jgi:hypothetical protein
MKTETKRCSNCEYYVKRGKQSGKCLCQINSLSINDTRTDIYKTVHPAVLMYYHCRFHKIKVFGL